MTLMNNRTMIMTRHKEWNTQTLPLTVSSQGIGSMVKEITDDADEQQDYDNDKTQGEENMDTATAGK